MTNLIAIGNICFAVIVVALASFMTGVVIGSHYGYLEGKEEQQKKEKEHKQ